MPSGGRSELKGVVPVILLAPKGKEREHELKDIKMKLQRPSPRLKALRDGLATMKCPRRCSVAGGEKNSELRCSGVKEKGKMGAGGAQRSNHFMSTVNLDEDQPLR